MTKTLLTLTTDQESISAQVAKLSPEARRLRKAIGKRQAIGKEWDGAANDNAAIAWPLARALATEGNIDLLKYAMMYRRIYDSAKSDAKLGGSSVSIEDEFSYDQYYAKAGSGELQMRDNGDLVRKYSRKSNASSVDIPARRNGSDSSSGYGGVPKPWTGDRAVNDMIDNKARLAQLQRVLGHLCEPFELACIDGATLQAVGNSVGIANRAGSMGAGRALVHTALVTLRDCMGKVTRADLE
ncbi:hypothetical protein E2A64_10240 [Pseudohoeflea suaedae]|uniref:Uncharacterized protein n=1 Tax=Pseudohoeflea suaedae TaxID=877384 RepID=A0A4R5PJ78_9HYPH|nr:hypothetical protein [Pseudohoeflea suaedae]TDH35707.1 hypothetical protein E2A64_10240 [Pseudohoeflea suaedae]